jgi:ankyrin repeat protein
MAPKTFLNNITIPSPCSADWNSMLGNDQVRFCQHCQLDVQNLSMMSRNQVERLIARSNGRLCVRYVRDPQGRTLTLPVRQKLHHIGRRVSRIAAGAFTATLSITSAVAQNSATSRLREVSTDTVTQPLPFSTGFSINGKIADQNGAVISGATISVSNAELNLALFVSTGDTGEFTIDRLQPGFYDVRVEAPGFVAQESQRLYVGTGSQPRIDRTLRVAGIEATVEVLMPVEQYVTGGAMAIVEPENPFIRAAQQDDMDELTTLIAGTDINARDVSTKTTALEHAVRNANREMVQLLISAGASVNARNEGGETVLMMIDSDATSDLIWDLINAGASVNLKDEEGNTALMRAAEFGNLDAVRTLLDAGAPVNDQNEDGVTALMKAADEGHINVVRALVLAGANLDARDNEDETALDKALSSDHPAVVRFLKSKGAFASPAKVEKEQKEEQ